LSGLGDISSSNDSEVSISSVNDNSVSLDNLDVSNKATSESLDSITV